MLELLLGNWKIFCVVAVICTLLYLFHRIVHRYHTYNRIKSIEHAYSFAGKRKIYVFLYTSRNSYKTAALINMVLKQSVYPNNIHFMVYEELSAHQQDVVACYKENHTTVENYSLNIHVVYKPVSKRYQPTFPEIWKKLVDYGVKQQFFSTKTKLGKTNTRSSYFLWLSHHTTFIIKNWDKQLLLVSGAESSKPQLLTSVPLSPKDVSSSALPTPQEVFRSSRFVDNDVTTLGNVVRFPVVNKNRRLRSKVFKKDVRYTNAGLQTPLLHPYFIFGQTSAFAMGLPLLSRKKSRQLVRHLGQDLAPTGLFGPHAVIRLLPFSIYVAKFRSQPPPKRKRNKHSVWQSWLQNNIGVDLYKGVVRSNIQLGMWESKPNNNISSSEWLLGVLSRYGSEREFMFQKNKLDALQRKV